MSSAGSGTPIERALLLSITILTLLGLLWFILNKIPRKAFEKEAVQSRASSYQQIIADNNWFGFACKHFWLCYAWCM